MIVWLWLGFTALIVAVLIVDFGLVHRKARVTGTHEALAWTVLWIALSLAFNVAIYFIYEHHWLGAGLGPGHELDGRTAALQFFTGYVVQKALSIDNIFVIALIFSYFRVPLEYQHRVLVLGIFTAVLTRGLMIAGGLALIQVLSWTTYLFGVLLIFTALRMLAHRSGDLKAAGNPFIRLVKYRYPLTAGFDGEQFITTLDGQRAATPLLHALVMIGSATLIFAVDSIPAIMAVTREPFIVFSSIIFAVLGLHSLYFLLASMLDRLHYLKLALVCMLVFVGVKMLLANHQPIPTEISLTVIAAILISGVLASLLIKPPAGGLVSPLAAELEQLITLTLKSARRVVILVTGSTVLLVGVAMIVTPGPAILVIPAGLAILGTEFLWARRLLKRFRQEAKSLSGTAMGFFRRTAKKDREKL